MITMDILEVNQNNVLKTLEQGDKRMDKIEDHMVKIDSKIDLISDDVLLIKNAVLGNGVPGLCSKVSEHEKVIQTMNAMESTRDEIIAKVIKHESFFDKAAGVLLLAKFVGGSAMLYVIILITERIMGIIG